MEGNAQMRVHVPLFHTIFQPECQRIHAHSMGQIIRHALGHKIPLRNPVTPHGSACHQVCVDRVAVGFQHLLIPVKLFKNIGRVGCNGVGMGCVCTLIGICHIFPCHQCAVFPHCTLDLPGKCMAHTGTDKGLLPGQFQPDAVAACLGT